jgi:hypothetical protein
MINKILWVIYISLLAVVLPHTEWAFRQFEPGAQSSVTSWAAAFAFEAAIAALTHKLAQHIELTPKRLTAGAKFRFRYLNSYSLGLLFSLGISTMANLAHAVEFGGRMVIFTQWNIPFGVYAVAFGAVLPVVSYTFANVLSNVVEADETEDPAVGELRTANVTLRKALHEAEAQRKQAEARLGAMGDVFVKLASADKRERILAVAERWPALSGNAIAALCESSPAYVSEVLASRQNLLVEVEA